MSVVSIYGRSACITNTNNRRNRNGSLNVRSAEIVNTNFSLSITTNCICVLSETVAR